MNFLIIKPDSKEKLDALVALMKAFDISFEIELSDHSEFDVQTGSDIK